MKSAIVLLACVCLVAGIPPPHPDVVSVRHEEEQLPPHLKKTAIYNPHLQKILPLTSLLHSGEKLVIQREAHDVSRKEIYNILTHAGFIPRRHPLFRQDLHKSAVPQNVDFDPDWFDIPFLQAQDLLQHL